MIEIIGRVDQTTPPTLLPLAGGEVRAGFPSPADDYLEGELDLVAHLVRHPSATYYLRARGESMQGIGIYDGDLLIVDRSLDPRPGHVVIMSIDGELTCKRLGSIGGQPCLIAENPAFAPIPLTGHECQVWGIVTHNIHALIPGVGR
ncbi:LexA family protein [Billgrantia endophytica]|uniref:Peptidase S24 n=1 Tax=Billgrantia endophytica TaxID=2033802 RepID=A0A2N7TX44_9GAMM|nr:translesion error-prone DNA polymerase V autoproteolytic subunit [Halomonas endophytica]PMR72763.1 peptidase S24 [Halomonas endophytica]